MIRNIYFKKREEINSRLEEFKCVWNKGSEKDIFAELLFCILTPQSKAKVCWQAIIKIVKDNLLITGKYNQILKNLVGVRFKYKKASYIIEARKLFVDRDKMDIKSKIKKINNVFDKREWLVKSVKGIGFKEASHFLRNIGFGENIAILDRHILKNLVLLKVIKGIPENLTKQKYYEIEEKMKKFSSKIKIPISHLDLLFWSKETGEIFK
ncbi:MAG: N-glycosylase/DNA lyase [Candidatus Firestonebacteria bacterium]